MSKEITDAMIDSVYCDEPEEEEDLEYDINDDYQYYVDTFTDYDD